MPTPKTIKKGRCVLILLVMILTFRSVFFEPFRIPSGSMIPTLVIGDFILVNKFSYGFKVPFSDLSLKTLNINWNPIYIFGSKDPERGDVIVFKYPRNPAFNYIKRVVGVPGDTIEIKNKVVHINGEAYERKPFPEKNSWTTWMKTSNSAISNFTGSKPESGSTSFKKTKTTFTIPIVLPGPFPRESFLSWETTVTCHPIPELGALSRENTSKGRPSWSGSLSSFPLAPTVFSSFVIGGWDVPSIPEFPNYGANRSTRFWRVAKDDRHWSEESALFSFRNQSRSRFP